MSSFYQIPFRYTSARFCFVNNVKIIANDCLEQIVFPFLQIVDFLNDLYVAFDEIICRFNVYKVTKMPCVFPV